MNATIGHNMPPPTEAEALRGRLAEDFADLLKRRDDLVAACDRLPSIGDDDTAGKVGDYIKLVTAAQKNAEAARVDAKEPFLAAGRTVDGFFKPIGDALTAVKAKAQRSLTSYLAAKEAAARREAEEAAKRAREEAERKAAEAARIETDSKVAAAAAMDAAVAREAEADKLDEAAAAKPAEFARTRGDYGSVSTLRERTVGEITDRSALDLEALRPYLPVDGLQKALNAFIRAGGRELRGARIHTVKEAAVS